MIERQRSLHALAGHAYGIRQPVMQGELLVNQDISVDFEALDTVLSAAVASVSSDEAPSCNPSRDVADTAPALVLRLLHWCALAQHGIGMPVFEQGRLLAQRKTKDGRVAVDFAMPYVNARVARECLDSLLAAVKSWLEAPGMAEREVAQRRAESDLRAGWVDWRRSALSGVNMLHFLRAAHRQKIPWRWLAGNIYELGYGVHARWLDSSFTDRTSNLGAKLARDKSMAASVLRGVGLPVPSQGRVDTADQASEVAGKLGYPVVVKPADKDGGLAVASGLTSPESVTQAFERAREHSSAVLVEKHVDGQDYRLIVLNGELVWAILRVPGGVVGDGEHSVEALLEIHNADPRRGADARSPLKTVDFNDEARELLEEAELTLDSVPEAGQFVRLRRAANVGTGGIPVGVLDEVHPDNRLLAVRAAAALKLDFAGIDLLISDISRSWMEVGGAICEVNAQPQLGTVTAAHLYGEVLRKLIDGEGRIPLIVILGEALAEMIALTVQEQWQRRGWRVGRASNAGAWLGGSRLTPAGQGYRVGARAVLSHTEVDAAVIAVTPADVLRSGLFMDRCDVLVLAGAGTAMMGASSQSRTRFTQACRVLLPHADRLVINTDDPLCRVQRELAHGAPLLESGGDPRALAAAALRDTGAGPSGKKAG